MLFSGVGVNYVGTGSAEDEATPGRADGVVAAAGVDVNRHGGARERIVAGSELDQGVSRGPASRIPG